MKIIQSVTSKDNKAIKFLQKTSDMHVLEIGYYDLDEHVICISSQIGCLMGCVFCATTLPISGLGSFVRNLTCEEILSQVKNVLY